MVIIHPSSSLSFLFHSSKTTSQTEQKSVIRTSSGGYSTVTNKNKMHNLNELKKWRQINEQGKRCGVCNAILSAQPWDLHWRFQSRRQAIVCHGGHCLLDLLTGLSTPCPCGVTGSPWTVDSIIQVGMYTKMFADFIITFVQKGHVVRVLFVCRHCHQQKRTWASSRIFSGHYLINQK